MIDVNIGSEKLPVMIINLKHRSIVSIPTQIGCVIGCTFCISSQSKASRSLTAIEMHTLAIEGLKIAKNKPALLSLTGEGEPFLNIKNINQLFANLADNQDITHFRVCTSGIRPDKFAFIATDHKPVDIQLSLHSPNDDVRRKLIPKTRDVADIINSMITYQHRFNEIAVNYVLMDNINDSDTDAMALKNIIPTNWVIKLNPMLDEGGQYSASRNTDGFYQILKSLGSNVMQFNKVGSSIKNGLYGRLTYDKNNAIALSC